MRLGDPGLFALKSAARAALVMPTAFFLALVVFDLKQAALFASLGSMAMLVFVDFGGPRRARLRAYLGLAATGAVLIPLGTLCSRSPALATVAMAVVGFAILFAGVLNAYVAAAQAGAILGFVLAVMVPAGAEAIPGRLLGWGLAAILCTSGALLLWRRRPPPGTPAPRPPRPGRCGRSARCGATSSRCRTGPAAPVVAPPPWPG